MGQCSFGATYERFCPQTTPDEDRQHSGSGGWCDVVVEAIAHVSQVMRRQIHCFGSE